uniref:Uncharacterized protein n=1 Tax=Salix viminalis TaxID=40686 RepID=A0A6N2LMC0_SALVM
MERQSIRSYDFPGTAELVLPLKVYMCYIYNSKCSQHRKPVDGILIGRASRRYSDRLSTVINNCLPNGSQQEVKVGLSVLETTESELVIPLIRPNSSQLLIRESIMAREKIKIKKRKTPFLKTMFTVFPPPGFSIKITCLTDREPRGSICAGKIHTIDIHGPSTTVDRSAFLSLRELDSSKAEFHKFGVGFDREWPIMFVNTITFFRLHKILTFKRADAWDLREVETGLQELICAAGMDSPVLLIKLMFWALTCQAQNYLSHEL